MTLDPLQELWTSQETANGEAAKEEALMKMMNSIQSILDEDRIAREKERRAKLYWIPVFLFLPVIWGVAITSPTLLIRAGYSVVTVCICLSALAIWMYTSWSRQALPGPADTRSQLRKAAYVLSRQANLARVGPIWGVAMFLGMALIGWGGYQETGHWERQVVLWVAPVLLWPWLASDCRRTAADAEKRKARMEELLRDLG